MNLKPLTCSALGAFALIAAACNPDTPRQTTSDPPPAAANARAEFDLGKPA